MLMHDVFLTCHPLEVLGAVIRVDAIDVVDEGLGTGVRNKGLAHKPMNECHLSASWAAECYPYIPFRGLRKPHVAARAANMAEVADFVIGKGGALFPNLHDGNVALSVAQHKESVN